MKRLLCVSAIIFGLSACVQNQSLYEWGSYQHDLLVYSKNPGDSQKFSGALRTTLDKAEAARKVPPGLYAEYGYTLLDAGDAKRAVEYFGKERDRWPESAVLMNKLIDRLGRTEPAATGHDAKPTNDSAPNSGEKAQ